MPHDLEITCPSCGESYSVTPADLGREATCHECGAKFTARRWNPACWWIAGAIVLGVLLCVQAHQTQNDPRGGGAFVTIGVTERGFFAVGGGGR